MSNKLYTSIPAPKVPRNVFNLSRYNSLTMPYQRVCPAAVQEIVPGDQFRWSTEVFARLQPMVAPVMTDQKISVHAFFVPLRTVNSHFAEFMFNNKSGNYTDVLPYTTLGTLYDIVSVMKNQGIASVSQNAADIVRLYDYIGLPFSYRSADTVANFLNNWLSDNSALSSSTIRVNIAPFIAYTKVWSEYFRDENLVEDPFDTWTNYGYADIRSFVGAFNLSSNNMKIRFGQCFLQLRPRAWQHDRFTSSLPFAQRGPDVLLPVTGTFDVTQDGPGVTANVVWNGSTGQLNTNPSAGEYEEIDLFGSIDGISTTINDFRRAERLQRWYENSARGGVRPNEATLAHFGVRTPDATLDRAEFLGGTMQPIVVSEVAQTSQTTTGATGSPQGTLAGKGTSYKSAGLFKHFFTEHGFVFVFTSALVRPAYWQGVPRVFSRMQRDEYYWPEFALLGEEPVYDKELFVDGSTTEDGVFGYVPRYADYKSALPEVHGDFRSSLDFWVNPRKFANQPALNAEFIFGNPQKKMFAVVSDFSDSLLVTIRHDVKASRLMPFYGVPTI